MGNKWLPIEQYDAMKKKPKRVVFWVQEEEPHRNGCPGLGAAVVLNRRYGHRIVTHFYVLPEDPE